MLYDAHSFRQDLSAWCVKNFPGYCPLTNAHRPVRKTFPDECSTGKINIARGNATRPIFEWEDGISRDPLARSTDENKLSVVVTSISMKRPIIFGPRPLRCADMVEVHAVINQL